MMARSRRSPISSAISARCAPTSPPAGRPGSWRSPPSSRSRRSRPGSSAGCASLAVSLDDRRRRAAAAAPVRARGGGRPVRAGAPGWPSSSPSNGPLDELPPAAADALLHVAVGGARERAPPRRRDPRARRDERAGGARSVRDRGARRRPRLFDRPGRRAARARRHERAHAPLRRSARVDSAPGGAHFRRAPAPVELKRREGFDPEKLSEGETPLSRRFGLGEMSANV